MCVSFYYSVSCVWVTCSSCQEEKMEKCELGVPLEASLDWNWSGGHLIHFKSFKRVEGCLCVLVLVLVCNRCVTMTGYLSSSDMVYMEKHWDLTQKTHAHTLSQWKTRWFRAHSNENCIYTGRSIISRRHSLDFCSCAVFYVVTILDKYKNIWQVHNSSRQFSKS